MRALPQSQVRSDRAEGLLPDAGVAVRLRRDGLPARARRSRRRRTRRRLPNIDAQVAPLRPEDSSRSKSLTARSWRRRSTRSIPTTCSGPSRFRKTKRTPGEALLAGQVIRTTSVSQRRDRPRHVPEDPARTAGLERSRSRRSQKQRPKPLPMAAIVTDGDYRFAPDGPRRRARARQRRQARRHARAVSLQRAGPLSGAAIVFPDPRRCRKPRLADEARLHRRDHVAAIRRPRSRPPNGRTSGRRRALAEWLGSAENPLTARVIVNRIWHHHFGPRHRRDAGQLRQDGRNAHSPGVARLAGGGVHEAAAGASSRCIAS